MADRRVKVTLDADVAPYIRAMQRAEEATRRLRREAERDIRVRVRVNDAELRRLEEQLRRLQGAGSSRHTIRIETAGAVRNVSHLQRMLKLVVAAIPPVSSALISIPGLLSPIVSGAGAVVVGFEGIKKSAQRLEPAFDRLQAAVAGTFEEDLVDVIDDINRMMPSLERGLKGSAEGMSQLAGAVTSVLSSQGGLDRMNRTFDQSNEILRRLAPGVDITTDNFARLADEGTAALIPMTGEFTRMSLAWEETIARMSETGEIESGIQGLVQVLGSLGVMIPAIVELGNAMTGAFGPSVAEALDLVTSGIETTTAAFRLIPQPVNDSIVAIGGMVLAYKALQKIMATGVVTAGFAAAGTAAALAATRMGATAGTVGRLGSGFDRLARSAPYVGAAMIGTALVVDKFSTSFSEASESMMAGEKSIDELAHEMDGLYGSLTGSIPVIGDTINGWLGLSESYEDAKKKLEDFRAGLDPLVRAQVDARLAQTQWNDAVNEFGVNSPEAKSAAENLARAIDGVEREEREAALAMQSMTDALIEQRDQMLASVDADLALRQARLGVKEAQDALNTAIRDHGAGSAEAAKASLDFERSLLSVIGSVTEATRTQYAHLGASEANKLAVRAQTEEIMGLVRASGTDIPPALMQMAGSIDAARWAAEGARISTDNLGRSVAILPDGKTIVLNAETAAAQAQIEAVARKQYWATIQVQMKQAGGWSGLPVQPGGATGGGIRDGRIIRRAGGGPIVGEGTGTSDSIPAIDPRRQQMYAVSNGEYIFDERAVENGGGFAGMMRLQRMLQRGVVRFAGGGGVGTSSQQVAETMGQLVAGKEIPGLTEEAKASLSAVRDLTLQGLSPLAGELTGNTVPSFNLTADVFTQASDRLKQSMHAWMAEHGTSWQRIVATAGQSIGQITGPQFGALHQGMDAAQTHAARMADFIGGQFGRIPGLSGDPIRWMLNNPINLGLVRGWNAIADQFKLDQRMSPVPGFAEGGYVDDKGIIHGQGTTTSDSILIRASRGERIIDAEDERRYGRFFEAVRQGQPEAIQAMGGAHARGPRGYATGGVIGGAMVNQALQGGVVVAKALDGTPYIWGGNSRAGTDCSGYQGMITRGLRGEPNPYTRIGATGNMPWPGFLPGLNSAYAVGFFKGGTGRGAIGHTAGTLGGVNVESGGGHGPRYGGPSVGADSGQFPNKYHLPQVGGQFVGGGGGGGPSAQQVWDEKMAEAYRMTDRIRPMFGAGISSSSAERFSRNALADVKRYALGAPVMDRGGMLRGMGVFNKATVGDERVLDPRLTPAFDNLAAAVRDSRYMARPVGMGGAQKVDVQLSVGGNADGALGTMLKKLVRGGQLELTVNGQRVR